MALEVHEFVPELNWSQEIPNLGGWLWLIHAILSLIFFTFIEACCAAHAKDDAYLLKLTNQVDHVPTSHRNRINSRLFSHSSSNEGSPKGTDVTASRSRTSPSIIWNVSNVSKCRNGGARPQSA